MKLKAAVQFEKLATEINVPTKLLFNVRLIFFYSLMLAENIKGGQ